MGIEALQNLAEHSIDHAALGVKSQGALDTHYLQIANNLSDLSDDAIARGNLDVYSTGEVNTLLSGYLTTETDPLSLHIDQTDPQTITGGAPIFDAGIVSNGNISATSFTAGISAPEAGTLFQGLSTTGNALLKFNTTAASSVAGFQFGNTFQNWVFQTTTGNDFQIGNGTVQSIRFEGSTGRISFGDNMNAPGAMAHFGTNNVAVPPMEIKAIASQTAAMQVHLDSSAAIHNQFYTAHATNVYENVFNEQGSPNLDHRIESDNYDALFIDASNDSIMLMSNAAGKVGFFGVTAVVQQAELTDELTTITYTAPGTPDYAIQDFTQTTPWGFASQDEANTVLSVIANLQTRVNELETKLVAYGLLIDAD